MAFATLLTGLLWATGLGMTVYGTCIALKRFKMGAPHLDAPFGMLPVSILKPLKGRDEGLRQNLESFFRLNYPRFEILFSVADARDPAAAVVRELMESYPRVPARLIVGQVEVGTNPKVNNLVLSYRQARHDWLLISDSNVRVEPDYLKKLAAHIETGVGMVTAAVVGRGPSGWGAQLEAVYLNTFYVRGMYLAQAIGRPCVVGKSMLFQRSTAERFGGISALACYLAEDYMAGEAIRRLGLQVVLASEPVTQYIGSYSFKEFWSRHLRWGRIRKAQAPVAFFLEPYFSSIASGLFGAWTFWNWLHIPPALFMTAHLLTWSVCDLMLLRRMRVKAQFLLPLAWFLREILYLPLWIHIASGNTVNWRGKRLTVEAGGLLRAPRENAYS